MNTKRTKASRARGNKTHGWGHKKKHRGKGNRGGKGNAGGGKRADSKKPSNWKDTKVFGRYGFTSRNKIINTITLRDVDKMEGTDINLEEMGYDKLLGTGKLKKKVNIIVPMFTKKAEIKVKEAKGTIKSTIVVQEKQEQ